MGISEQTEAAGFRTPEQSLPEVLPADPWGMLQAWLDDAKRAVTTPNHNAMTLATVGAEGRPSARVVLCKIVRPDPGYIVFFTNYESRKSEELEHTPFAAACLHWDVLGRQIRIEGPVTRSPEAESDDYFASRSVEARLGAWASRQSRPIESREALLEQVVDAMGSVEHRAERDHRWDGVGASPPVLGRMAAVGLQNRAVGQRARARARPGDLVAHAGACAQWICARRVVVDAPAAVDPLIAGPVTKARVLIEQFPQRPQRQ